MNQKEIKKITDYIFLESNPQKSDLALVFGTRHSEAINKVYELYQDKFINKILVSGGINKVTKENEAEKMAEELIKLGVKENDIILENKSMNSLENVLFLKKIIDEKIGFKNIKKIIIVAKHYHSRRALMTLKKYFPKTVELILITYEIYGFTKDNWFKNKIGEEKVFNELRKIQKYLKKGDIKEL
ncbi:YdcF family protein [Candidatus Atribacteria bacterium MT.SAG.1]|nr:YdcF family protein [Candidatus Atribacteria bacterium MT.SAG.1]